MVDKRYIVIRVAYEPNSVHARSLEWIAPELKDAGLTLIEEHADECGASRTWAGVVDGATSQRFADAWHLPDEFHEPAAANLAEDGHIARVRRTLDGRNWEVDGESPIVYVSVEIGVIKRPLATGARAQNLTPAQQLRLLLRAALLAGPGLRCRRRARSLSQAAVLGPRDDRTVPLACRTFPGYFLSGSYGWQRRHSA